MSGRPPTNRMFLRGTVFDPPRAGISPNTTMQLIGESFLDAQRHGGQEPRDAFAGLPVPVELAGRRAAVAQMVTDRFDNPLPVVVHVNHVPSPVPAGLPGADVDGRNAQERTLTDRPARIAHNTAAAVRHPQKILWAHTLEKVHVLRRHHLTECADPLRGPI